MSKQSFSLLHCLRTMSGAYRQDARNDAELIERFVATHDETAVATLAVRHGPMVWEICRRILGNDTDAEDAYQVTFLALAKQAAKIRVTDTAAGWLCQVARRSALNGRKVKKTQQKLQSRLQSKAREETATESEAILANESYALLYEELEKLSEKQRVVLVLHYLEGKTQQEVAEILCVGKTAVSDRLNRAKSLLLKQLAQRGLTLAAAGLVAMLEGAASHAAMPRGLLAKTVQAAAAFCDGQRTDGLAKLAGEVLRHAPAATPWWKASWMITLLCISGLGLGAGGLVWKTGLFSGKPEKFLVAKNAQELKQPEAEKATSARCDLYGDPLPPGALARLGTVRFRCDRFSGYDKKIVVTPDKKLFIPSETSQQMVDAPQWFDLLTGKQVSQFQDAQGRVVQLASDVLLSFDGRILAQTDAASGNLRFWNLATGKALSLTYESGLLQTVAISPGGKTVAFSSGSVPMIWDVATGKSRWAKTDKDARILQLAYSPDGKILLAASWLDSKQQAPKDRELIVRRWDVATGKELKSWMTACHNNAFTWSRDGTTLAVQPEWRGDTICVWDMRSGKRMSEIHCDRSIEMGQTTFSNNGKILARVCCKDPYAPSICLWDTSTGKLLRSWQSPSNSLKLAFCENDDWLVAVPVGGGGQFIPVWDVSSGKLVNEVWRGRGHEDATASLSFSCTGAALASSDDAGGLFLWEAVRGKDDYAIRHAQPCCGMKPGSDCRISTVSSNGELTAYFNSGRMLVRETATGRTVSAFKPWREPVMPLDLKIFPNNRIVALHTIGQEGYDNIFLFDAATGKSVKKSPLQTLPGTFAVSPQGDWVAYCKTSQGREDKWNLCLWNATTDRHVEILLADRVGHAAFSPDGDTLAVNSHIGDGNEAYDVVSLWRMYADGGSVRLEGPRTLVAAPPKSRFSLITFSPNGRILATTTVLRKHPQSDSEGVIQLWETSTGAERSRYIYQGRTPANSLAFTADGLRLASGHNDSTILIWDLTGRLERGELRAKRLSDDRMASLWNDLAGSDARRVHRAMWTLAAGGASTASFFETRLQPAKRKVSAELLSKLITELDDQAFAARRKAMQELRDLGSYAEPALREVLKKESISVELRNRVKELVEVFKQQRMKGTASKEETQGVRALEVLEHIGSDNARRLLEVLSSGDAAARLTQEARSAVVYWKRVHQVR